MKLEKIKNNIPVLLLIAVAPYFFYSEASLPQAIIAASLAALSGYKYYLEQKQLPDYEKVFATKLEELSTQTIDMGKISDDNFKKVEEQIISIKQKMGMEGYVNTQKKKLAEVPRPGSVW